jgi:endonuclease/exonuclease/phosphatase family metal-dependent hydrolase
MRSYRRIATIVLLVPLALAITMLLLRRGADEIVLGLPADAAAAPAATEITLASYNVQARPYLDEATVKLPQISPRLNAFDVAMIQECFERHDLLWSQAEHPNKAYFGRLDVPWRPVGSGLSAFSRLPVSGVEHYHYAVAGEFQNQLASKGMQLVRLVVGGMTVDVYNTHMEAGDLPEAHVARDAQAREMVSFVEAQSPESHAVILTGDFNMGPKQDRPYDPDRRGHYSTAEDRDTRAASFAIIVDSLGVRNAQIELDGEIKEDIEHFLYRDGTGVKLTPLSLARDDTFADANGHRLSDGAPLVARFRVEPR